MRYIKKVKEKKEKVDKTKWHPWFAWFPVKIKKGNDTIVVFFEYVLRKGHLNSYGYWWEYDLPGEHH